MPGILTSLREDLVGRLFLRGTVQATEQMTPKMRRVRIHGPALAEASYEPGQHVRVKVGALFGLDVVRNETLRAYTVWSYDRLAATIEVCALDHPGKGPGARWAASARAGDEILFRPPEGKLVPRAHDGLHLFIGDETASVAFGAILRALPSGSETVTVVETESNEERLPLEGARDTRWITRHGPPTGDPALLLGAARDVARSLPRAKSRTAYLAGEATACKAIRGMLVESGWARSEIVLKPFWKLGAKGLE